MDKVVQQITLDVAGRNLYKYVYAKQGDSGSRFVKATILADGKVMQIGSGMTAKFRAEKPDGKAILNPATVNDDGTVTVELTKQTLAADGVVDADIVISSASGEELSTVSFKIEVEKAPFGSLADSKNEMLVLQKLIEDSEDALEKLGNVKDGKDGVSPTVSTAATIGGTKVTITDANGSHEFVVKDGANGSDGDPATDAQVSAAVNSYLDAHPEATTTLQDGAVTPDKTSFIRKVSHNILNWNDTDVQDGYFLYDSKSAKTTGGGTAAYSVSGYIAVIAGAQYCLNYVRTVRWLDASKSWVANSAPNDVDRFIAVAPENAAYMRIDVRSTSKEKAYIYENIGVDCNYSAYASDYELTPKDKKYAAMLGRAVELTVKGKNSIVTENIPDSSLRWGEISNISEFHWNIIDPLKCKFNIDIDKATGEEKKAYSSNLYYMTSDYTVVESGETLLGGNYGVYAYDSDKQYLSKLSWNAGKWTIPENVRYIRVTSSGYLTAQDSAKIILLRNEYGKTFKYTDDYSYSNTFPMFSTDDSLNGFKGYLGIRRRCNQKISVIGDSFTAPSTWVNIMCENLLAYKLANHAVSGGAFSDYDGVPKTAYEQAQEMVANGETPDIILVTLGTNDCSNDKEIGTIVYSNDISSFDLMSFSGGMQACINYLANNFPTAKLYVGWTPMGGLYSTAHNPEPYITRMKEICMIYGIQYIETRTCGVSPLITAHAECFEAGVAGGHPTNAGQQRIGDYMARLMECTP